MITQETRAALLADMRELAGDIWEQDRIRLKAFIPGLDEDIHKTIPIPRITRQLEAVKPPCVAEQLLRWMFGVSL